jgi:hypothetical protein
MQISTPRARLRHAVAVSLTLLLAPGAGAFTVDAGDIVRLPAGTDLALGYYQHFSGDKLYARGQLVSSNAKLEADVGVLRGVHYADIGGLVHGLQFLQPFGSVRTGGDLAAAQSTNGLGDLILADTIHLLNDPEGKRAWVVTPFLFLPTGRYDRQNAINAFGENRWKLTMQTGYLTPFIGNTLLDVLGDVTFYGRNRDFGATGATMKQSLSYEFQAHLRLPLGPSTFVGPAISHAWGGETEVAGIKQDDQQKRTKAMLTVSHFVTPTWQVLGSFGKDLTVRTGVKEEQRMNLRLLKVF